MVIEEGDVVLFITAGKLRKLLVEHFYDDGHLRGSLWSLAGEPINQPEGRYIVHISQIDILIFEDTDENVATIKHNLRRKKTK